MKIKKIEIKTKQKLPPWRNSDGSKKTDSEIYLLGQNWDMETWNTYLNEDIGKVENEDYCLISISGLESLLKLKKGEDKLESYSSQAKGINLSELFEIALEELSEREYCVLKEVFWNGQSVGEVARKFNMSKRSIYAIKVNALKKLKITLVSQDLKRKFEFRLKNHQYGLGQGIRDQKQFLQVV